MEYSIGIYFVIYNMPMKIICIYTPLDDQKNGNFYWFHTVASTIWQNLRAEIAQFIKEDIGEDIETDLNMGASREDLDLENKIRRFLGNNQATIWPISKIRKIPWYHLEILFLGN